MECGERYASSTLDGSSRKQRTHPTLGGHYIQEWPFGDNIKGGLVALFLHHQNLLLGDFYYELKPTLVCHQPGL